MLFFNKAFDKNGKLNPKVNYHDYLGEGIVYSESIESQIDYLSEVSNWLSTIVDFVGGPVLSGALLAQTIATLSGGELSPFSISKPNGLYKPLYHYNFDLRGLYRNHKKNKYGGKIAIVDDVLSQGTTLSHSLNALREKPVEVIVVFKIIIENINVLPDNIKKHFDKVWIVNRD